MKESFEKRSLVGLKKKLKRVKSCIMIANAFSGLLLKKSLHPCYCKFILLNMPCSVKRKKNLSAHYNGFE